MIENGIRFCGLNVPVVARLGGFVLVERPGNEVGGAGADAMVIRDPRG